MKTIVIKTINSKLYVILKRWEDYMSMSLTEKIAWHFQINCRVCMSFTVVSQIVEPWRYIVLIINGTKRAPFMQALCDQLFSLPIWSPKVCDYDNIFNSFLYFSSWSRLCSAHRGTCVCGPHWTDKQWLSKYDRKQDASSSFRFSSIWDEFGRWSMIIEFWLWS